MTTTVSTIERCCTVSLSESGKQQPLNTFIVSEPAGRLISKRQGNSGRTQ
jgi:hypothetical protein